MSTVEVDLTNFFDNNVCDTCGDKATHAVRNKVEEPNSSVRRFTYSPWRFGWDTHKKRQITRYLDGTWEQAAGRDSTSESAGRPRPDKVIAAAIHCAEQIMRKMYAWLGRV